MKIHGIIWSDAGGNNDPYCNKAKDLNQLGDVINDMGIDYEYWSKYKIRRSLEQSVRTSLIDLMNPIGDVFDCDLMIVHIEWLIRFGGHASKWDSDICKVLNDYDGPVIVFINEMKVYQYFKTITKSKFGVDTLRRPVWIANPRDEIPEWADLSGIDVLGHIKLNQSHAYAYHWLKDPDNRARISKQPRTPEYQFIYGGLTRDKKFMNRLDNAFKTFGYDDCLYYGQIADKYDKPDSARAWGEKLATVEQLMELNSKCRYSALPGNLMKPYLTPRAFEQGFSDSLVLCDMGYEQEDCGFPVVDFNDTDEMTRWRDLPESDRVNMVIEQHDRLASIDHYGKIESMVQSMIEQVGLSLD